MSGDVRIAKPSTDRDPAQVLRSRRVAFFGHDAGDAAVRRRVRAFQDDGVQVTGFMMRRGENNATDWENIDLGRTHDGAFMQRVRQIFTGARLATANFDRLAAADVIYARNLDMLACAFLTKREAKLDTPVIYEALDVHRLLTRGDIIGRSLRWLEGRLLRRTRALVVSSPAFLRNHFERHYPGLYRPYLIENRLAAASDRGNRPGSHVSTAGPLRLGWVGNLRCQRSFLLLCDLADRFPGALEIHLHGVPSRKEIPVFEPEIANRSNMSFHGAYRSPEDLADIYGGLDLVWAGDFMEAGFNSVWLLPNRIYEGGYFSVPAIAPDGTETAAWIAARKGGFLINEPLEQTMPTLVQALIEDRSSIVKCADALSELPHDDFVQPVGVLASLLDDVLQEEPAR